MARTEASQDIQRSPLDVFEYVRNPEHYPDWAGIVLEARNIRQPTFTQEGHYTSVSKFLGRRMELNFRMTVTERPLALRLESMGGPVPHSWHYTFEPRGNGTRVTVEVDGDPGTFFALAAPLVMTILHREIQTELLTLKNLLETVVPARRVAS
ncbi:SRPBCC family protein [Deinococcus hohokamensis]|uniref:SRPBCC family protein n=1 Tax=Deinococcus hohokamensis TaxID=309883 RepID=A0ABV9IB89_9DEIO